MGTSFVNWLQQIGIDLPTSSDKRQIRLGFDVPLALLIIVLIVFGLLMVYSASWDFGYTNNANPLYFFERQVLWVLIGLALLMGATVVKYQLWVKAALPMMVFSIAVLVLVLFTGEERHGAIRGLSAGSYQPSELAKLVMVIYLSVWLFNRREELKDVSLGLIPLATILGLVGGLIFLQPDLSAVITVVILGGLMFFLAGGELKQIIILLGFGFLMGFLVYKIVPNARVRIDFYWAGVFDLLEAHPHVQRAVEAFVNGSWFGTGIGKAMAKLTGLPFPHTDSIFAVVGEETGVVGSAVLVLIYLGILWRGLLTASRAQDRLGRLLAAGLSFWLVIEAMVNMGVMVGILPFAGNALPFISYGGSNMLVSMLAVGIILNISRQVESTTQSEERIFNEVVDLRGGNRRRRVSRPVRSSGAAAQPRVRTR